jgi:hypothetical protein
MPEVRPAETQSANPVADWNTRRLALIEKKYTGGLTAEEAAELVALQAKMDEHLNAVAPVPLRQVEALEEEVRTAYPDYPRSEGEAAGAP